MEKEESKEKVKKEQSIWELIRFAVFAIIILIPLRLFVVQPFIVSGSSMVPTFENGNYLMIDEISYRLSNPKRYDVVVFKYPIDPTKYFIKRIIGLPNETIDIKENTVTIINKENPQGFILEQPFVKNVANNIVHVKLKNNEYFVMGDNRSASSDSRYWGAVPSNLLIGKAFLRLLPISKVDIMPGNYEQTNN